MIPLENAIAETVLNRVVLDGDSQAAARDVIALLRERADDTTYYCARFGVAAYEADICERYGHLAGGYKCGMRWLLDLGEP